jgi:CBS-domain-containing membrane protein
LFLPLYDCSILVVSVTDHFMWRDQGFRLLVASFGASAVLLYGVPESKLSQPRNLIGKPGKRSHAGLHCVLAAQ